MSTGPDPGPAPGPAPGPQPGPQPGSTAAAAQSPGKRWHFFCPGHYTSYRKATDPTRHAPGDDTEGSEQYDHANEYGPSRNVQYLAQQDMASHVSTWPQHAGIAVVEQE